jgi:hypothetical protein
MEASWRPGDHVEAVSIAHPMKVADVDVVSGVISVKDHDRLNRGKTVTALQCSHRKPHGIQCSETRRRDEDYKVRLKQSQQLKPVTIVGLWRTNSAYEFNKHNLWP